MAETLGYDALLKGNGGREFLQRIVELEASIGNGGHTTWLTLFERQDETVCGIGGHLLSAQEALQVYDQLLKQEQSVGVVRNAHILLNLTDAISDALTGSACGKNGKGRPYYSHPLLVMKSTDRAIGSILSNQQIVARFVTQGLALSDGLIGDPRVEYIIAVSAMNLTSYVSNSTIGLKSSTVDSWRRNSISRGLGRCLSHCVWLGAASIFVSVSFDANQVREICLMESQQMIVGSS